MQTPEQSGKTVSASRDRRQKLHRDPLHLRMYFHRHLTEFVRLFGHRELTIDEARVKLRPLVEEFGEERINETASELLMIVRYHPEQTVRLTDEVRRLARPLIGPSPEPNAQELPVSFQDQLSAVTRQPTSANSEQEEPGRDYEETTSPEEPRSEFFHNNTGSPIDHSHASARPISLPIREVRVHFENWLRETGQSMRMITPEQRAEFSDKRLSTLDAIVYGEDQHRLVTIRRQITKLQIHDMLEWQKVFGSDFRPYTVWPYKGSDGWAWEYSPLTAGPS